MLERDDADFHGLREAQMSDSPNRIAWKAYARNDELLPEANVRTPKQRKLVALAAHLISKYNLTDRPVRFDVIGVDLNTIRPATVRHHIAAFEVRVQPATGVGNDQQLDAQRVHYPYGQGRLGCRVAFIQMKPPCVN